MLILLQLSSLGMLSIHSTQSGLEEGGKYEVILLPEKTLTRHTSCTNILGPRKTHFIVEYSDVLGLLTDEVLLEC